MSEPKRYIFRIRECGCVKPEHLEGKYAPSALIIEETEGRCGWVSYEDYDRLKAEVERLTKERDKALTDFWYIHEGYFRLQAEVNRLTAFTTRTIIPNEELQAQVERLTKAGDALSADVLFVFGENKDVDAWKAAKEGKPHA